MEKKKMQNWRYYLIHKECPGLVRAWYEVTDTCYRSHLNTVREQFEKCVDEDPLDSISNYKIIAVRFKKNGEPDYRFDFGQGDAAQQPTKHGSYMSQNWDSVQPLCVHKETKAAIGYY